MNVLFLFTFHTAAAMIVLNSIDKDHRGWNLEDLIVLCILTYALSSLKRRKIF